jgi:hypothetical protein
MADKEEEPTMEQFVEQLRNVYELSANLPSEYQTFHKALADLYEKISRAQSRLKVYSPEKIEGE